MGAHAGRHWLLLLRCSLKPPPPSHGRYHAMELPVPPSSTCSFPAPITSSTHAKTAQTKVEPSAKLPLAVPSSTSTRPALSSLSSRLPTRTTVSGTSRLPATTTTLTLAPPAPTWLTATSPRMLRFPATL